MMQVSHQDFGGFFRGVIRKGNEYRFTRKQFTDGEAAEIYALELVLRWRMAFEGGGHGG